MAGLDCPAWQPTGRSGAPFLPDARLRLERVGAGPPRFRQRQEIGRAPRLNSSHANISYAVFCFKKKQRTTQLTYTHTTHNQPLYSPHQRSHALRMMVVVPVLLSCLDVVRDLFFFFFFFLMIWRPPSSTLFPYRRSSD